MIIIITFLFRKYRDLMLKRHDKMSFDWTASKEKRTKQVMKAQVRGLDQEFMVTTTVLKALA